MCVCVSGTLITWPWLQKCSIFSPPKKIFCSFYTFSCFQLSEVLDCQIQSTNMQLGVKYKDSHTHMQSCTFSIFVGMELILACFLNKNYLNIHKPEQHKFDRQLHVILAISQCWKIYCFISTNTSSDKFILLNEMLWKQQQQQNYLKLKGQLSFIIYTSRPAAVKWEEQSLYIWPASALSIDTLNCDWIIQLWIAYILITD